jgi:hypothetical protein
VYEEFRDVPGAIEPEPGADEENEANAVNAPQPETPTPTWKERYRELEDFHVNFIEAVESIAQVDYWGVNPMAAADWDRARRSLQDAVRSARREIGQP